MTIAITNPGQLTLLGREITRRLQIVFPPTTFEHQVVPARVTAAVWKDLTRRTPFVGLGWAAMENNASTLRNFDGLARWTVFLATRNERNVGDRYYGDPVGSGLFQMIAAAVTILHGHTLAGVGSIKVLSASNAYAEEWESDSMAIATVELAANVTFKMADTIAGDEVSADVLKALGIAWNFEGDVSPGAVIDLADNLSPGAKL